MASIWRWNLRQLRSELWVPVAAYGLTGLITAVIAGLLPQMFPEDWASLIKPGTLSTILQILAGSLFAATTFSVSIMLSAFGSAASGATPRATPLLQDDSVSQSVLATFVGAFVYSLVSIIGLETQLYSPDGRLFLFVVTLAVITAVIAQLVRWIGHLAHYGRLPDTIARVEDAAAEALTARLAQPYLGGRPLDDGGRRLAQEGVAVLSDRIGYLQVIDIEGLHKRAESAGLTLAVQVLPGAFVHRGTELLHILTALPDDGLEEALRDCFAIAPTRTFSQDPRFGIIALTEIASRALSPAVNDPGTAIDILGRQVRVLSLWAESAPALPRYPRVMVPGLRLSDLMLDAFAPIARDGAGLVEVQLRLQKALLALVETAPAVFGEAAIAASERALALAETALVLEADRQSVARQAERVRRAATRG